MRADEVGSKVDAHIRTLTVYPLIVEYEVRVEDRMVVLLAYELASE